MRRLVRKNRKTENHAYQVRFVTYGDCISLKNLKSIGVDEGGQLFSSLAVIHKVDAAKTLHLPFHAYHMIKKGLTLLVIHTPRTGAICSGGEKMEEYRRGGQEVTNLYHLLAPPIYKASYHLIIIDHAQLGIGSLLNYLSLLY